VVSAVSKLKFYRVHEQQTAPILEEEASFLANVGEITQGWLQLSEFHRINGVQELDFRVFLVTEYC
jgi:hypothetical protein